MKDEGPNHFLNIVSQSILHQYMFFFRTNSKSFTSHKSSKSI